MKNCSLLLLLMTCLSLWSCGEDELSGNARLHALLLSQGELVPEFSTMVTNYSVLLPNPTATLVIEAIAREKNALLETGSGTDQWISCGKGHAVLTNSISGKQQTLVIRVTAPNGFMEVYSINVRVSETDLANLSFSAGTLVASGSSTPGFQPASTEYQSSVTNAETSFTINARAVDPAAMVKFRINNAAWLELLANGNSNPFTLLAGMNTLELQVTAPDGSKKNYVIEVFRPNNNTFLKTLVTTGATLTPTFASNTASYTANAAYNTASITVTATPAADDATLELKISTGSWTALASGSPSTAIPISSGDNPIEIRVKAPNGTEGIYRIVIKRASNRYASFNPENGIWLPLTYTLMSLSSGKLLAGGNFTVYNLTSQPRIARINSGGSLDTTFGVSTGANGTVKAMALQSDGKILIAGEFTTYNGTSRNRIARLNSDGSLDSSFAPPSGAANDTVNAVAVQSDGKILIAGIFSTVNGTARPRIARLSSTGSLDTTFNPGTGPNGSVFTMALQTDGKIVIGGGFFKYNGTDRMYLARINSDGTLDTGFTPATAIDLNVHVVRLTSTGKVYVGGSITKKLARLNSNGSLDTAFSIGSGFNVSKVNDIFVYGDGKVLVGGDFTSFNGVTRKHIARLAGNGAIDYSFDPGTGPDGVVTSLTVRSDNRIAFGFDGNYYQGTRLPGIVILEP